MHPSLAGSIGLELILLAAGGFLAMSPQDGPPNFPFPPSYEVHISPSTSGCAKCTPGSTGPSHVGLRWSVSESVDLKTMIATVYKIDRNRVDIPPALNDGKFYDFGLFLPKEESEEAMNRLLGEAIKKQFRLTMTFETRPIDVYVLTAPNGASPSIKSSREDFGMSAADLTVEQRQGSKDTGDVSSIHPGASITGISVNDTTMEDLCRYLEYPLDRLVIDETQLRGRYSFAVGDEGIHTTDEFLRRLRDRFGLALAPGRRNVAMLVVRPA